MIVVADASPVIFLAKLDRLALIMDLFPGTVLIPESVRRELVQESIPFEERQRIVAFLKHCRGETVRTRRFSTAALSTADRHVLALAGKHPKSLLLTDDRLVRRIAMAEGLRVAGTLGVIIRAAEAKIMSRKQARLAIESLVGDHQLRISVDLYQEAMLQLRG